MKVLLFYVCNIIIGIYLSRRCKCFILISTNLIVMLHCFIRPLLNAAMKLGPLSATSYLPKEPILSSNQLGIYLKEYFSNALGLPLSLEGLR